MYAGNVKRSITIDDGGDDVFSDEIKTTALIEEIEAAEYAAKQARIEQQIAASHPTVWQKVGAKMASRGKKMKVAMKQKMTEMAMAAPDDPRVEKVRIGKRLRNVALVITARAKTTFLKKRSGKPKNVDVINLESESEPTQGAKTVFLRLRDKVNSLAPEGVSRKQLIEYCMIGALIVIAGEIWAWNLTHPLSFAPPVEKVPVTGNVEAENEETREVETQKTEAAETAHDEEQAEKNESGSDEGSDYAPANQYYYNYRQAANSGGGAGEQTATPAANESARRDSKRASGQAKIATPDTENIDSGWDDHYADNWPSYDEEQEEQEEPTTEPEKSDEDGTSEEQSN